MEQRKLYRSGQDKVIAGVCGGLGEYLTIDPVLLRVAWAAMVLVGGFGILLYIIWIFLVPLKPGVVTDERRAQRSSSAGVVAGVMLILLGLLFLADEWYWIDLERVWHFGWGYIGPVMLILIGVWFLTRSRVSSTDSSSTPPSDTQSSQTHTTRRIRKSRQEKKLFGVCGGIAEYTDVDPTVIRLLFVGLTIASPPVGILVYIALAIFMPAGEVSNARAGMEA